MLKTNNLFSIFIILPYPFKVKSIDGLFLLFYQFHNCRPFYMCILINGFNTKKFLNTNVIIKSVKYDRIHIIYCKEEWLWNTNLYEAKEKQFL